MVDQFTQTTTTGYGSRIVNSIKGIIFGLLLFVASFALLYWNEGRVDLSSVAKTATDISSSAVNQSDVNTLNGKLVSVTGVVNSSENIGDNLFLNPGNFIGVERKVEMYSWVENKKTTSNNNMGGSSTDTTTYSYTKDWKESPASSGNFQYPDGHQNPQKTLDNYNGYATSATVGAYYFDPPNITLPKFSKVQLSAQNTTLSNGAVLANDSYIFIPQNSGSNFGNPMVGDVRISYYVLKPGFNGTILGALNVGTINQYSDQKGNNIYRLFAGTRAQAISTLHSEYTTISWILRLVGFLMMWFGLSLLFAPISVLLDILPIFGELSRVLIGVIAFLVSLVLTIVTILISMVAHSIIALIITLVITVAVIVAVLIFLREKKKAKSQPAIPPQTPTA